MLDEQEALSKWPTGQWVETCWLATAGVCEIVAPRTDQTHEVARVLVLASSDDAYRKTMRCLDEARDFAFVERHAAMSALVVVVESSDRYYSRRQEQVVQN